MTTRSLASRRLLEILGIMMVGEGVIATATPSRYAVMWFGGPRLWRKPVAYLVVHRTVTRLLGLTELVAGMWIALRQQRA